MLLRIIDKPASSHGEDAVKIVLQYQDHTTEYVTESYDSPVTDNFRTCLAWYFNQYPQTEQDDKGVVAKLIKLGQNIGDELLGEAHQLVKISEDIEQNGYHNLQVRLESVRPDFFNELWETMVLPGSKYMLSTVVKGFVRQLGQIEQLPDLHFGLKVTLVTEDNVSKMLQGEVETVADNSKDDKPLKVLYIVSRAYCDQMPYAQSNSINTSLQAISAGGAVDYEVYQAPDWPTLQARLADQSRPVHILHYDGAVTIDNDESSIAMDDGTPLGVAELSKSMVANKVAALSIDGRVYLQNGEQVTAAQALSNIAQTAHQQGLGNVTGLGQLTNPWTAGQCFDAVYTQVANALSLAQAVVEGRKKMQSSTQTSLMTAKPVPFHPWSLLLHYSIQAVTFFDVTQMPADPNAPLSMGDFADKLFGFKTELLPPMLYQVSDGQVLDVVSKLAENTVSIIGGEGTGKSQLTHVVSLYLAQKQQIDFGFYFDFAHVAYTPADMLEMIAPVLSLDVKDKTQVEQKLATLHCCFVLDNVQPDASKNLTEFVARLVEQGHKLMLVADSRSILNELATVKIAILPLTLVEQKILASNILQRIEITPDILPQQYQTLLESLKGQPWLTKKLMPLLASQSADELILQAGQLTDTSIEAFYQSQWQALAPVWQKLLILCGEVRGLLLEMLMIATDHKQPFPPAKTLFGLLGDAHAKFSDGLTLWDNAGFITRFPHGRMIDERFLNFLTAQRKQVFFGVDQQGLILPFSQLICYGIGLLSQHVVKQPNANITNNLLINRRHWVKYFETLWFANDYSGFVSVKANFDQLLQQARLGHESEAWIADLLQRTPVVTNADDISMEAKLSWLMLAAGAVGQPEAHKGDWMAQGAQLWQGWFDVLHEPMEQSQLPLFQQVVTFLERYYQNKAQWQNAITICQGAYRIYSQYGAWQRVIQALKSLAQYHFEIGEKHQSVAFEDTIINDIPYNDAPAGFKNQQMMDILLARLGRKDTEQAQNLLDQIRQTEDAKKLTDMLDGVQCDIHYQSKNYADALPYYCQNWAKVLPSEQAAQIEPLQSRLLELELLLGTEHFNAVFEREVPAGTQRPPARDCQSTDNAIKVV